MIVNDITSAEINHNQITFLDSLYPYTSVKISPKMYTNGNSNVPASNVNGPRSISFVETIFEISNTATNKHANVVNHLWPDMCMLSYLVKNTFSRIDRIIQSLYRFQKSEFRLPKTSIGNLRSEIGFRFTFSILLLSPSDPSPSSFPHLLLHARLSFQPLFSPHQMPCARLVVAW